MLIGLTRGVRRDRVRRAVQRAVVALVLAAVAGAMVFGERGEAPSVEVAPPLAGPEVLTAGFGPAGDSLSPAEVAEALREAGFQVRVQRSPAGAVISNPGNMRVDGSLNVQLLAPGKGDSGIGDSMISAPLQCMTVRSALGRDGFVLYAPALVDSAPGDCVPSERDRTDELITVLQGF